MEEVIPDGLKEKHLKYFDELQKMLPKGYFVKKGNAGWPIKHKPLFFMLDFTVGWVWWHSMEIECGSKELYPILKELGDEHKFKLIRKNFIDNS